MINNMISIIIPSIGRNELKRAIASVRNQTFDGKIQLIVIFDLDELACANETLALAKDADLVLFTGGRKKGGSARNLGIQNAEGEWIAYLDDDDEWLPSKLEKQLVAAEKVREKGSIPVVGCLVELSFLSSGKTSGSIPKKTIEDHQSIHEYLFHNRRPGSGRASFFTSTIFMPAQIAKEVKWDESLTRHQDWDLLVRLGEIKDVRFLQLSETLVSYYVGSNQSISASSDWKASLYWVQSILRPISPPSASEFLSAQTLRYALHNRSLEGTRRVFSELWSIRRVPSIQSLLVGLAGAVPRKQLERLMARIR